MFWATKIWLYFVVKLSDGERVIELKHGPSQSKHSDDWLVYQHYCTIIAFLCGPLPKRPKPAITKYDLPHLLLISLDITYMLKASKKRTETSEWKILRIKKWDIGIVEKGGKQDWTLWANTCVHVLLNAFMNNEWYLCTCCGMQKINPHHIFWSQYLYTHANNFIPISVPSLSLEIMIQEMLDIQSMYMTVLHILVKAHVCKWHSYQ